MLKAIFGFDTNVTADEFKVGDKFLKDACKSLNKELTENEWLAGTAGPSFADYAMACYWNLAFATTLDAGFCKAKPHHATVAWFKKVSALPAFVKVMGHVKMCEKAVKPVIKVEEKKKAVVVAKVEKKVEEEKPRSWEDTLPACAFDLYNFKTFFVNHKDKKGEGLAETKKMFQAADFNEGYSWHWIKYQRYGDEGQVQWRFANLLNGFMQRTDPKLSKFAFGVMHMIGEEPDLNIEGVWMFRSQDIPPLMHDNPQLEYFDKKKLDFMNNEEDYKLIAEFFGAPKEDGNINGRPIQQSEWFK